ncbi:MAG: chromate efflux transporter [Planctomycetota bacterium]
MSAGSPLEVLTVFLKLGLTSFGGPVAHLAYFRDELVTRRQWIDEDGYAEIVALCQFLPGPASSQVGIALGLERAGFLGALAAWVGFTLPSAALLVAFALGLHALGVSADAPWLHGLKIVAVVVVALAVWGMAQSLCPDRPRASLAILAAIAAIATQGGPAQLGILAVGALLGRLVLPREEPKPQRALRIPVGRRGAIVAWAIFFGLLGGLAVAERALPGSSVAVASRFFRAGSLVFGGGHVVLPLLQREVVDPGWVTEQEFLAGYGAAQAVPGPLFSFAAYLGAVLRAGPGGVLGAALALCALYAPAFILVVAALPAWNRLRGSAGVQAALRGANAAVVGLLLAALYDPVWTSTMKTPRDFVVALGAFLLLGIWRMTPWVVVVLTALSASLLLR